MEARQQKALELTGDPRITFKAGVWTVPSQRDRSVSYRVDPNPTAPSCTCEDFQLRQRPCKHIAAVRLLLERQIRGEPTPTVPERLPRKSYPQAWEAYNRAQESEFEHAPALLADLCRAIPEPPRKGGSKGGRKPVPLADQVFAAVYKVYSTLSARRFMSDLREARERGHVATEFSSNVPWVCLQNPDVTPILYGMVHTSSLPLRSVETQFAVDSTGFGTSKFERWYDEKYGFVRQKAEWVKVHCSVGTKTNVVAAAWIGDKNAPDCPQMPGLIDQTAQGFTVAEVSGDKAYLSYENLAHIDGKGAVPYIPFKSNSLPGATPLWDRMYHYFNMRRDEFLSHYHQRSNSESSFSAIKRKFGDAVRSKTPTAMVNEVLAKLVCFNISCLIHEWHELGIDPTDWGLPKLADEADCPRPILRFPG